MTCRRFIDRRAIFDFYECRFSTSLGFSGISPIIGCLTTPRRLAAHVAAATIYSDIGITDAVIRLNRNAYLIGDAFSFTRFAARRVGIEVYGLHFYFPRQSYVASDAVSCSLPGIGMAAVMAAGAGDDMNIYLMLSIPIYIDDILSTL